MAATTTDYRSDQNGSGKPPTNELGSVLANPGYLATWNDLFSEDLLELNQKWQFPQRINTVQAMRADAQVQGLITGTLWPIYRMMFYLEPNGSDDADLQRIAADLNLPIGKPDPTGKPPKQRRTHNRFKFGEHVELALDAVPDGVTIFEQNGFIGKDGKFHYRKLAERPLHTIDQITVLPDGGIDFIKQNHSDAKEIPIERLVVYPFMRRGANWFGRSILRGCFAPWLLKDRAMRVGVMNIQRAGVGTPIAEGPPGASPTELGVLNQLMERFTAGERTGGAVPYGSKVRLIGVEGSQPDTVGFIKLMNEEMSRAFFEMFMQLGQTTSGSRALGQTFVDYHKLSIEYIASWFTQIFNEHVIEDDIEWNNPTAEYAPLLCWHWNENQVDPSAQTAQNTDPRFSTKDHPGGAVVPGAPSNKTNSSTVPDTGTYNNRTTAMLEHLIRTNQLDVPEDIRAQIPGFPEPEITNGRSMISVPINATQTSGVVAAPEAPRANAGQRSQPPAPGGEQPVGASLETNTPMRVEVKIVR
jgi:hypothetical protein